MSGTSEIRLSREMGLLDITMIGVGAMIGAGIFVLTGIAAGVAGPGLLLAFLLNGLVTLFAAGAYAELGSSFHDAGGGYLWVKTGLKDPQGFLSGWMSWFAHAVACSLYALGFGAYFQMVLKMAGIGEVNLPFLPLEKWLAVAVVALFAFVNYLGASETGKLGNIVTIAKIIILGVFVAFGIAITLDNPGWEGRFQDFLPNGMGGVFIAMGLTFIAFEGYEIIAQCSEEVREPKKNVPRAVFLSLLVVVPIYLLVAFAALGAVDSGGMAPWKFLGMKKELALVEAASHFFRGGGMMILVGGLFSTVSALNATIYSSSRVSFAMGRDRNLPAWFGKVHPKRKTPHWAILASSVLIAFMASALPIEAVASAADIMFLLLFVQVLVVLCALRKKRPDLDRGFRVPWVPLIPIVGIAFQVFLAGYLFVYSPKAWISAAAWITVGLGVFYGYSRKRDRAYAKLVAVQEAAARRDYRILACVADPKGSKAILETADVLASKYGGEVVGLSVIEVPEGEALAKGLDHAGEVETDLDRMLKANLDPETPRKAVVTVAHRVSYGIIETALEESCNLILMRRTRSSSLWDRIFATSVDRVVRSSPAQLVLVSGKRWPSSVKRILVPFDPSPHTDLALDLVGAFAGKYGAAVRVVRVLPDEARQEEVDAALSSTAQASRRRCPGAQNEVVRAQDVIKGLMPEVEKADLIIMGGSEAGIAEQLLSYSVPLEMAERTDKAMILVYEMAPEPKRWIS